MTFRTRRIREEKPKRAWKTLKKAGVGLRAGAGKLRTILPKKKKVSENKSPHSGQFWKKLTILVVSVCAVFLLLFGVAKALVSLRIVNLHSFLSVASSPLPADSDGYTNFLLLGRGDKDHDGVDLTDTMMIVSIDPNHTHSAVFLSIPRDLYILDSQKMGKGRINELYRDYKVYLMKTQHLKELDASKIALNELADELGRRLHMQIHHVVILNFSGFVQAVDALGGIDVTVPYDIVDTTYPGPDYSYETFSIKAGLAHLDGETALKYVRSRHTTSDFGRSARQQQVIKALGEKARALGIMSNPGKLLSLYGIFSKNVETTMTTGELLSAADAAQNLDQSRIVNMQLNDRNGLYSNLPEAGGFLYDPPRALFGGASILLPVSIPENPVTWKQIECFARLIFRDRSIYLEHPTIQVSNAGGKPGIAGKLSAELTRYGLIPAAVGNAPDKKPRLDSSVVPGNDQSKDVAQFFATLLKLPLAPPPPQASGTGSSITIILGKNFLYSPIQDLLPAPQ